MGLVKPMRSNAPKEHPRLSLTPRNSEIYLMETDEPTDTSELTDADEAEAHYLNSCLDKFLALYNELGPASDLMPSEFCAFVRDFFNRVETAELKMQAEFDAIEDTIGPCAGRC